MNCPNCGEHLYFDGKCFVCTECGYWCYNHNKYKIII